MNAAQNTDSGFEGRDRSELDWLAFQYIAGEFTPDQAEEFEERLATDQEAREAVARAVELSESTMIALDVAALGASLAVMTSGATTARHWLRPVAWTICGIAAAVAIALTLAGVLQPPSNNDNQIQFVEGHGEVRELAMAWATARTDLASETATSETTESSEVAISESGVDVEESEGIETPSWMLIAVAGLTGLTQNGTGGPGAVEQIEQGLE